MNQDSSSFVLWTLIGATLAIVFFMGAPDRSPAVGTLQVVAEMDINPGNIAVNRDGRVFVSIHQFRPGPHRLVEVTGPKSYKPWPNAQWNGKPGSGPNVLNAVLGVQIDSRNWLWALDNGLSQKVYTPKLVAFDVDTGKVQFRYDFPPKVAPPGSFLNDLAVDRDRGRIYIADIGGQFKPAIVVVDLVERTSWRFENAPALQSEDKDLVVGGKVILRPGPDGKLKPARVPVNPITLSADGSTLYFGAMTGTTWWSVPTEACAQGNEEGFASAIRREGPKPVSDGASTDRLGNHYFTGLADNAVYVLRPRGKLELLVSDPRISWPDALSFGRGSWLYIASNQLHLSPFLNQGKEGGKPPYRILRVWTGSPGIPGR